VHFALRKTAGNREKAAGIYFQRHFFKSLLPTLDNLRNFFLRLPTEMLSFFQQWQEAR
jgi:hypothetical protein